MKSLKKQSAFMIISIGEILVTCIVSLVVLKPSDIIPIMRKSGEIAYSLRQRYADMISELENWWSGRR